MHLGKPPSCEKDSASALLPLHTLQPENITYIIYCFWNFSEELHFSYKNTFRDHVFVCDSENYMDKHYGNFLENLISVT